MNPLLPYSYFGNIAYFEVLAKNKTVEISGNERYQKQTYRTRTKVIGANGIQALTVPVERPNGKETKSSDLQISYTENWGKEHLKTIESAYRNAPYFIYYFDSIETLLNQEYRSYTELAMQSIEFGIEKVGLEVNLEESEKPINGIEIASLMNPKSPFNIDIPRYIQVFEERHGFQTNLSILDLLFNEGPNSITILLESKRG
ncbi:MAG: WbqC family protein [Crocinitomicaceae bacterium]|nr:WbqC family protein [Crocinitomicaceae bacterium]